jgi:hypothetical protein
MPSYDFCQTDCFSSNLSSHLVEEHEKNNISKDQHDPTMDFRDMATRALLVPPDSALLSSRILYCLTFFLFFLTGGLFVVLKAYFPLIIIISLIYAFMYFILFFM